MENYVDSFIELVVNYCLRAKSRHSTHVNKIEELSTALINSIVTSQAITYGAINVLIGSITRLSKLDQLEQSIALDPLTSFLRIIATRNSHLDSDKKIDITIILVSRVLQAQRTGTRQTIIYLLETLITEVYDLNLGNAQETVANIHHLLDELRENQLNRMQHLSTFGNLLSRLLRQRPEHRLPARG